jgi:hypothetical protein
MKKIILIVFLITIIGCTKEEYEHQHHYDYIKTDSCYRAGRIKYDSIVMPKKPHIIYNINH